MKEMKDSILMDHILQYLDLKKFYVSVDILAIRLGVPAQRVHALAVRMEQKKQVRMQMFDSWNLLIQPAGTNFLRNGGYVARENENWLLALSRQRWFLGPASFTFGVIFAAFFLDDHVEIKPDPQKNIYIQHTKAKDTLPHKPTSHSKHI